MIAGCPDPESHSEVCSWPKPISSSGVTISPTGSVAKIRWPHKILWKMLVHSHYIMWLKYFLQQSPVISANDAVTIEAAASALVERASRGRPETIT
jgi:hypothetical protein